MRACDDYRPMIPLYLKDELSAKELQDFRRHVLGCTDCTEFLAEEHALSQLLRRSRPLYRAPEVLRRRLSAAFDGWHRGNGWPKSIPRRRRV
jgi:hypothetical protein